MHRVILFAFTHLDSKTIVSEENIMLPHSSCFQRLPVPPLIELSSAYACSDGLQLSHAHRANPILVGQSQIK